MSHSDQARIPSIVGVDELKLWFDRMEAALREKAIAVGLTQHPTITGGAREFIVKEFLREFLPPIVQIGSGSVLHENGSKSRQQDIVLYDARLPVFGLGGGQSLFVATSVLATVEVKSRMGAREFGQALENCLSVYPKEVGIQFDDLPSVVGRLQKQGRSREEIDLMLSRSAAPSTFVFAFTSSVSLDSLANQVAGVLKAHPSRLRGIPLLPRVCVLGNLVVLLSDMETHFEFSETDYKNVHDELGSRAVCVAVVYETNSPFCCLAIKLLCCLEEKIGPRNRAYGYRYGAQDFLPVSALSSDFMSSPRRYIWVSGEVDDAGDFERVLVVKSHTTDD